MLLSPVILRARQKSGIISAAIGIILYTIVKSIFVECGWGLALAAGPFAGFFAETVMLGCGIAFFRELKKAIPTEHGTSRLFCVGVILIMAGKNLSVDYRVIPDISVFILGRAAQFAMLIVSAYLVSDEAETKEIPFLSVLAVISVSINTLAALIAGQIQESSVSTVAPMLILTGCCHLTVEVSGAVNAFRVISPGGLAAGFMLSYCFDCLCV